MTGEGRVVITVKPNGPLLVEGPVTIQDPSGQPIPVPAPKRPGPVKLCRCGRSAIKPFCDGTHRETRAAGS